MCMASESCPSTELHPFLLPTGWNVDVIPGAEAALPMREKLVSEYQPFTSPRTEGTYTLVAPY